MPGKIRRSDIDEVRNRTNIAEVIGQYVTLKPAGIGSMKGLCPFHDERSPSFHVRPQLGYYHCFGCGEGGDVFSFLQKYEHMTFAEAVEELAARLGIQLHYEDGPGRAEHSNRARILAANSAAAAFFAQQLSSHEAKHGRSILVERGFDRRAAEYFGLGYAPRGWDNLRDVLREQGYRDDELITAGLLSQGSRGGYDRFRGRLIWPIRDLTGQTVGFGARKIYDDDEGPKYLNTPETPVYHKSQVLYGLDLAKRDIAKQRRAIIVEGYTDVMACHLAGITTAVATCGTAFGTEHIKVLRRILADDESRPAEVIFTFDPDAAGQKAAMRAFAEDKKFVAQTYIAVPAEGLDPSDLRQYRGDAALRHVFEEKEPLFAFAIRQIVGRYDLETVEGRAAALKHAVPLLDNIRDQTLVPSYAREIAGFIGESVDAVMTAYRTRPKEIEAPRREAERHGSAGRDAERPNPKQVGFVRAEDIEPAPTAPVFQLSDLPRSQQAQLERDVLEILLQYPELVSPTLITEVLAVEYQLAPFAEIAQVLQSFDDVAAEPNRIEHVMEHVSESVRPLVQELAVAPLPVVAGADVRPFAEGVLVGLLNFNMAEQKRALIGKSQRLAHEGDTATYREVQQQLVDLEAARRRLLARIA